MDIGHLVLPHISWSPLKTKAFEMQPDFPVEIWRI